jgi:hypothetical protein
MKTVMEGLGNVLKGNMTDHVISEAKMEGTDMIYFDDFLGDGDVDNKGNKVVSFFLGLWCLTPHSTILQIYRGGHFYLWRKPKYPEKITNCRKSLINFITYCCIEYTSP